MTAREDAINACADDLNLARAQRDALAPRAVAESAWYPGHRLGSIEAIEAQVRARRAAERMVADAAPSQPLAA